VRMDLLRGLRFTAASMALVLAYHLALWGLGQVVFPSQAEGSLVRRADGGVAGSRLIAQEFTRPEYFQPRPSAVDYDAAGAGGSNDGPSNPDYLRAVRARREAVTRRESVPASAVPSEMVTASGSGLDPDLQLPAARLQAARVAAARGMAVERVLALVRAHTRPPALGFLGPARVNVLELNLALDRIVPPAAGPGR
jgi:K+-transporting ATPase ATPase C chain